MNVDERTQETAATLLGVAFQRKEVSCSDVSTGGTSASSNSIGANHWEGSTRANENVRFAVKDKEGQLPMAVVEQVVQKSALTSPQASVPLAQRPVINLQQSTNSSPSRSAYPLQRPEPLLISPSANTVPRQSMPQQHPHEHTLLAMSSIGFGIDSSAAAAWGDATEAAIQALQDAMKRSTLRLPAMTNSHSLQIKVQLGVPPKQDSSGKETMVVDISKLTTILPRSIPVLPIQVSVGGLFIPPVGAHSPAICTAVACVTLQSQAPPEPDRQSPEGQPSVTESSQVQPSPWASLEGKQEQVQSQLQHQQRQAQATQVQAQQSPRNVPRQLASVPIVAATTRIDPTMVFTQPSAMGAATANIQGSAVLGDLMPQTLSIVPAQIQQQQQQPEHIESGLLAKTPRPAKAHRSNSIEMLAMVSSEEMRLATNEEAAASVTSNQFGSPHPILARRGSPSSLVPTVDYLSANDHSLDEEQLRNGGYNYKKLPPGVTTKNNRRLFVRHTYRDLSVERPCPEEQDLVLAAASASRTPNAAFPLKLHETLSQIEEHGFADIIGWMPHGRSFKIFNQKEFSEVILPRYFVMTKKSSFLRQLNLYGFNRFSAGDDQGSYYHEKFLRGLKFLTRRMSRQKVNGNRIRSAGNPDEEPVLARYPSCPATAINFGVQIIDAVPSQHAPSTVNAPTEGRDEGDTDDAMEGSPGASGIKPLHFRRNRLSFA